MERWSCWPRGMARWSLNLGLNQSLMLFWLSVAGYKGPEVLVDGSVGCRLGLFSRHVPLLAFCPSQKGLDN